VKIKLSPSKKKYLKGKHIYDYIRAHLPVPHKLLKKLEPYFKEDFQANITEDNNKIALTYTYFKRANQPKKSAVEPGKK
jgi:hypothetical protein